MDDLSVTKLYRSRVTREISGMILVQKDDLLEQCRVRLVDGLLALKSAHDPRPEPTVYLSPEEVERITKE